MKSITTNVRLSIIASLLLMATWVSAQQRSLESAMQIANEFRAPQRVVLSNGAIQSAQKSATEQSLKLAYVSEDEVSKAPYFYIFNKAEAGYVIVSGDERAYEILGYSDSGSFDLNNMPPNMEEYLNGYTAELKALQQYGLAKPQKTTSDDAFAAPRPKYANLKESVAPLLGDVQWNQGDPYNLQCPLDGASRSVTGCVATAMAQIMYYHKWPEKGQGSIVYITRETKKRLTKDFSKSVYDWENMTPLYSSNSTNVEKDAVALLMADCGYSVKMNYTAGESGAYDGDVLIALPKYFDYDPDIRGVGKNTLSNDEWTDIIKNELSENRPVYHTGQSIGGGHAFVCDGYTADDYFHFNWGWGGSQNGNFRLHSLDPGTGGIGAGSADGYNQHRGIIIGIQKPDGVVHDKEYDLNLRGTLKSSVSSADKDDSFTVTVPRVYNDGILFDGYIGAALCSLDSTVLGTGRSYQVEGFVYGSYYQELKPTLSVSQAIEDGNYRIYIVYRPEGESEWQIMKGRPFSANYLNVSVIKGKVTIKEDASFAPDLELQELTSDNLYCDRIGNISLKVKNNGSEYTSSLKVSLEYGNTKQAFELPEVTILAEDVFETQISEKVIRFSPTFTSPVEATLKLYYDKTNSGDVADELLGSTTVTLNPQPTLSPILKLMEKVSFEDNDNVPKNNVKLAFTIKNYGGYTTNKVYAWIFPEHGGTSLAYLPPVTIALGKGEQKTYVVSGALSLPNGRYILKLQYQNSNGGWAYFEDSKAKINFNLVDADESSVANAEMSAVQIYPNPAQDQIAISGVEVKELAIYDLSGRCVKVENKNTVQISELSTGTYLLRIVDKDGKIRMQKLMKQ